jgi:hypothetical protein
MRWLRCVALRFGSRIGRLAVCAERTELTLNR